MLPQARSARSATWRAPSAAAAAIFRAARLWEGVREVGVCRAPVECVAADSLTASEAAVPRASLRVPGLQSSSSLADPVARTAQRMAVPCVVACAAHTLPNVSEPVTWHPRGLEDWGLEQCAHRWPCAAPRCSEGRFRQVCKPVHSFAQRLVQDLQRSVQTSCKNDDKRAAKLTTSCKTDDKLQN